MSHTTNEFGLPVGLPVPGFEPGDAPPRTPIDGRYCRIEMLDPERHARDLFDANMSAADGRNWTYLPYGPFEDFDAYRAWMEATCLGDDPLFHTVIDIETGKAVGLASYLRIDPRNAAIEVGHIHFSPLLQRHRAATECMYLLMARVFDEMGYRRYEWKCDNLNAPSKQAAERLGFSHEGLFRQAAVVKGRNRDTAWFSILDSEWPALKQAFEAWLAPENFDPAGQQKQRLSDLTQAALASCRT